MRILNLGATPVTHVAMALAGADALEGLVLAGCTELALSGFDVDLLMTLPRLAYLVSAAGR